MNLLTPQPATPPTQDAVTLARIKANDDKAAVARILAHPAQAFKRRMDEATSLFADVWGAPVPADRLKLLGTNAVEVFRLAGLELAALEALQPGCTSAIQATIKPTTPQEDGTVTIS